MWIPRYLSSLTQGIGIPDDAQMLEQGTFIRAYEVQYGSCLSVRPSVCLSVCPLSMGASRNLENKKRRKAKVAKRSTTTEMSVFQIVLSILWDMFFSVLQKPVEYCGLFICFLTLLLEYILCCLLQWSRTFGLCIFLRLYVPVIHCRYVTLYTG